MTMFCSFLKVTEVNLETWKPENMQQIYKRTPMPKYDFNKVALQLY